MKILLDEHLTENLKQNLKGHDVFTVKDRGWRSVKNGELMRRMIAAGFDAFITLDRNLQHQQNFRKYPIAIIVLRVTKRQLKAVHEFAPQIIKLLKRRLRPGPHELTLHA